MSEPCTTHFILSSCLSPLHFFTKKLNFSKREILATVDGLQTAVGLQQYPQFDRSFFCYGRLIDSLVSGWLSCQHAMYMITEARIAELFTLEFSRAAAHVAAYINLLYLRVQPCSKPNVHIELCLSMYIGFTAQ